MNHWVAIVAMEVGSSIDTLCSVTFDVNLTWTQGEGGITVKLSVWYIVSFYRTSKLDLNHPRCLQIFRGDEAAAAPRP